jgi:subtilisin family serine protease
MRKLLLLSILVLAIFGCRRKATTPPTSHGIIPNEYIVIMKETFEQPVIRARRNNPNRKKQKDDNKEARARKQEKLKKFLKENDLEGKDRHLFVDIAVGAVVEMDSAKANEIKRNANVEDVIPNVIVQINPIQQTDPDANINPIQQWLSPIVPGDQINPIQQSDSIQNRYDIDTVRHWTKALVTAGGPTDGSTKTSVIWFLDTGIDHCRYLNVDPSSLGVTFFTGTSTEDDNGHGTFCAGIAAGRMIPGGTGLDEIHIGISEGAIVVPVKVLDQNGAGSWGTVIAGLNWVAQFSQPGDVVNLSLGAYDPMNPACFFPGLRSAIERVTTGGVFVSLSAGNDAGNALCNRPGCIDGTNIYTASSINADSTCALYANFGRPVDYVTVGTRLFSLWNDDGFRMASGTSASSALLAGIIHARNGPPVSGSSVSCMGGTYPIGGIR